MLPLYEGRVEDDWKPYAACLGVGAEVMHPTTREGAKVALAYCERCPVLYDCLDYGIRYGCARYGVWGGTATLPKGDVIECW